jgi:hypothetical protein
MKIHDFRIKFDRAVEYIPLVSAINYAIGRIQKHAFKDVQNPNAYQSYILGKKNWTKSKFYTIPLAKIIAKIAELIRNKKSKNTQPIFKGTSQQNVSASVSHKQSTIVASPSSTHAASSNKSNKKSSTTNSSQSSEEPSEINVPKEFAEEQFQRLLDNYKPGVNDHDFLISALTLMSYSPKAYEMIANSDAADWKSNSRFLEVAFDVFEANYFENLTEEIKGYIKAFIKAIEIKEPKLPFTVSDQGALLDDLTYLDVLSAKPSVETNYEGMAELFKEARTKVPVKTHYKGMAELYAEIEPVTLPTIPQLPEIPENGLNVDLIPKNGVEVDFIPEDGCNIQ